MPQADERLLFEHLGDACLAYLLNTTSDELRTYLDGSSSGSLNELQHQIISQLTAMDASYFNAENYPWPNDDWRRHLSHREKDALSSIGNTVRTYAGGAVSTVPERLSGIQATLAQLAVDIYPALLVKEDDSPFRRAGLPISLHGHPLNEQFQTEARTDEVLQRLFVHESETTGPGGSTVRSSGSGGDHQLWTFAQTILASGWHLARMNTLVPSCDKFSAAALRCMETIRDAVGGKKVSIPVRIGLTGVLLPESTDELDFGSVKLRKATLLDEQYSRLTALEGQLTGTNAQGQTVVINYSGDLVLEAEIPYLVEVQEDPLASVEWSDKLQTGWRSVQESIENVRLGLLLATPEDKLRVLTTWQVMFDPMLHGLGTGWSDVKNSPGLMPTQLTEETAHAWQEWGQRISSLRTPSVGVAIRRMLQAVAERRAADDILVDAVIVWENLFGAATETNLRVTSSIAWLLGDSATDRRKRQTEYKKIYTFRSQVVHGSPKVDQKKLSSYSQQAVEISIQALRTIFKNRPELLREKTSEDRSLQILHAGESKPEGT